MMGDIGDDIDSVISDKDGRNRYRDRELYELDTRLREYERICDRLENLNIQMLKTIDDNTRIIREQNLRIQRLEN